jgi:hypothetical protein
VHTCNFDIRRLRQNYEFKAYLGYLSRPYLKKKTQKTNLQWLMFHHLKVPNLREDECSGNSMYSCMKMEKWDLLKLFHERGVEDKGERWRG